MRLSNSSLKKLIKNATRYEIDKGYIYPYHASAELVESLSLISKAWGDRAQFSTAIRIDMMTNSTEISFEYSITVADEYRTIDLYVNGFAHKVYAIEGDRGRVTFSLPEGDKQVSIYLPTHSNLGIKHFEIDGSYTATRKRTTTTLALGDSIVQGHGIDLSSGCFLNALSRKTDLDLIAVGIGGIPYLADMIEYIDGVDKIIVALGTNGYETTPILGCDMRYDYEVEVQRFYERLESLYPYTPILCITPLMRVRDDADIDRLSDCVDIIRETCSIYDNITVVDGYALVPPIPNCYLDGLHPNDYGAELYAENLARVMRDIRW